MRARILIVDDDPAIRATLRDVLLEEGYAVETATNGAEGLAAVEDTRPAVVLLDVRMPILDGWGFARALGERGVALPIVMMSATPDLVERSAAAGTISALVKPFDLDQLLRAVERALWKR